MIYVGNSDMICVGSSLMFKLEYGRIGTCFRLSSEHYQPSAHETLYSYEVKNFY